MLSNDPRFDAALERCTRKSDDALGEESRATVLAYAELGNELSTAYGAWVREAVPRESEPLLDCLAGEGYEVPDRQAYLKRPYDFTPFGVPLGKSRGKALDWTPKRKPGTVEVGPVKPAREYVPSPRESDLAAAWYRCDEKTGRLKKLVDGSHQAEPGIVAGHEDRLRELNPKIEAIANKAARLVDPA
ncbi:hypothetical protein [Actinoplanes sp. NPDC049802]|uniref:hypothetical protein n=1 Tax=Actinoplanes sp. NPDC049802 TaxID=3154742 RepID=UPI0033D66C9E